MSVDGVFSSLQSQACDAALLFSMSFAGFAGRMGSLACRSALPRLSPLWASLSSRLLGLLVESGTFEASQRWFEVQNNRDSFAKAWRAKFLHFGILHFFGSLQGSHVLSRHLLSSSALVFADNGLYQLGLAEKPQGRWMEQWARAEAMNIALAAATQSLRLLSSSRLASVESSLEAQCAASLIRCPLQSLEAAQGHPIFSAERPSARNTRLARKLRTFSIPSARIEGKTPAWEQEEIPAGVLADPLACVRHLNDRLSAFGTQAESGEAPSLVQWVGTLHRNGRIPDSGKQSFLRHAAALDLYRSSSELRDFGSQHCEQWDDPRHFTSLVEGLQDIRRTLRESRGASYKTESLIHALAIGNPGFPPQRTEQYRRWAAARDFIEEHPELRDLPSLWNGIRRETFFWSLIRLKTRLLQRGENVHLGAVAMGLSLHRLEYVDIDGMRKPLSRTMAEYASSLDQVYERWEDWKEHFEALADLPDHMNQAGDTTRAQYARENLRTNSQAPVLADPTLYKLVRMGLIIHDYVGRTHESITSTQSTPERAGSHQTQRLRSFLEGEKRRFEGRACDEALALELVFLRRRFLREIERSEGISLAQEQDRVSLETIAHQIHKITRAHATLRAYGARLDNTLRKWGGIGPHAEEILGIRNPTRRVERMLEVIRMEDGSSYTRASVRFFYRWIRLIAQHREEIGL